MHQIGIAADIVMEKVMAAVDNGVKLAAAQRILERAAECEDLNPKLANMLRVCAAALPAHPEPRALCGNNAARLNAQALTGDPATWGGVTLVDVMFTADKFAEAEIELR